MNTNRARRETKPAWIMFRVVFIVLSVSLLAACAVMPPSKDTVPISGASAAATPTTEDTDLENAPAAQGGQPEESAEALTPVPPGINIEPKTAILSSLDALQKAGPYKASTTVTAGSSKYENIAEVILPDRYHVMASGQEILIAGSKSYIQQNGRWISYPVDVSGIISGVRGSLRNETASGMQDVKLLGLETINGSPAAVYMFKIAPGGNEKANSQVKLWIDQKRGLPVRQEINSETNGVKTHTVQVIEYDPAIKIDDPNQ